METLQEAAIEMLKEFKVLLNHSPLPISTIRLIQLLSLNMFAIDNGQLKGNVIKFYTFVYDFGKGLELRSLKINIKVVSHQKYCLY